MRYGFALIATVFLSVPAQSEAAVPVDFIGFEPHGPLARVTAGRIASPRENACRSWAKRGSRWKALDRLGRVVGSARVSKLWRYDLTNCDELTFDGPRGAGIFVRGPYQPLAIGSWTPKPSAGRELRRIIARRDAKIPAMPESSRESEKFSFEKRTIAFQVPGEAPRVVVGGRALTLLRWKKGRFEVELQEGFDVPDASIHEQCEFSYLPVAVLDMNGDGAIEIVVHEHTCDVYGDFTLIRDGARWRTIEAGISGAYA